MITEHLSKDKKLAKLVKAYPLTDLLPGKHVHLELVTSIMGQQLSTKVALVLQERFYKLFKRRFPKPQDILSLEFDVLRGIGLSNAKTSYIRNVCSFFIEHKLSDKKLNAMADEEVIALLTQIKGVGKWTVQMLLMFSLGREDVFPEDDFGIQKAMDRLYGLDSSSNKAARLQRNVISEKWRPYRSQACRYLWRSLDAGQ